jgi:ATP-dependent Clp protease ATP-binding subunit ClpA
MKHLQGDRKTTNGTQNAFEAAVAAAQKDGKSLNPLYLLAALMRHDSVPAIAELAEQEKVSMRDLIERCDLAAQVADATSIEQWPMLATTADHTANQWKHDYLGTEHLLMALIADGASTKSFLSEQGIEAAAIHDMMIQIYFSPSSIAPRARVVPAP